VEPSNGGVTGGQRCDGDGDADGDERGCIWPVVLAVFVVGSVAVSIVTLVGIEVVENKSIVCRHAK